MVSMYIILLTNVLIKSHLWCNPTLVLSYYISFNDSPEKRSSYIEHGGNWDVGHIKPGQKTRDNKKQGKNRNPTIQHKFLLTPRPRIQILPFWTLVFENNVMTKSLFITYKVLELHDLKCDKNLARTLMLTAGQNSLGTDQGDPLEETQQWMVGLSTMFKEVSPFNHQISWNTIRTCAPKMSGCICKFENINCL